MNVQDECAIVTSLKAEVARLQAYIQELYMDRVGKSEPKDEEALRRSLITLMKHDEETKWE